MRDLEPKATKRQLRAMGPAARAARKEKDAGNQGVRLVIEAVFSKQVTLWPHMDYKKKHLLFRDGRSNWKRLTVSCRVGVCGRGGGR